MIPIKQDTSETACTPEWVHLNHLLSYCTRQLTPTDGTEDGEAPRCGRQDCLFSAKRR